MRCFIYPAETVTVPELFQIAPDKSGSDVGRTKGVVVPLIPLITSAIVAIGLIGSFGKVDGFIDVGLIVCWLIVNPYMNVELFIK